MKLTVSDRDAFVQAVLDDVPFVDYDSQVRALLLKWAIEQMPETVRTAYTQHPDYFELKSFRIFKFGYAYLPVENYTSDDSRFKADFPVLYAEIESLVAKRDEQNAAKAALRQKIRAAICGCGTLKQAEERLAEFAKYLPADRDKTGVSNLPAVANLVTDLMNAGWPKDKLAA